MQIIKKSLCPAMLSLVVFSSPLFAGDCGEVPEAPEIFDAASATLEQVKENSGEVKSFVDEADKYLDCVETLRKSKDFEAMAANRKDALVAGYKGLVKVRNDVPESFNSRVLEYKELHPEEFGQ